MRQAQERGTDIERNCEGLPMGMLMPNVEARTDEFSSSAHSHGAGTPDVWTQSTNAQPPRDSASFACEADEINDSPPPDLLTELAVDGVDPLVPTIPIQTRTSRGELLQLHNIEDIGAFLARRAESPNRPQVPRDEPPPLQYGPAEREAFKADHQDYFDILERLPNPPISEPHGKWPGWPNSPSTRGHSPIAATPMRTHTDAEPVTIPRVSRRHP